MKKEWLNLRICDCEVSENTQTYKEYFDESIEMFGLDDVLDYDNMEEWELCASLDFLDNLWNK